MEELITRIRKSQVLTVFHILIYTAAMLFSASYFFLIDLASFEIVKYIFVVVMLGVLIGLAKTFNHREMSLDKAYKFGCVYYVLQLLVAITMFYWNPTVVEKNLWIVLIILFGVESVVFTSLTSFESMEKRAWFYIAFVAGYGLISIIQTISMKYADEISTGDLMRNLTLTVTSILVTIGLCEILTAIIEHFERKMYAQDRAMSELNEANDALFAKQKEIEKVNEKLGTQKIELQAANKKINRSHDEMSVQNEISSHIAASLNKDDLSKQVTKVLQMRLDLDMVVIILEEDNSLLAPGEEPAGCYVAMSTCLGKEFEQAVMKSVHETDMKEILALDRTYIQNSGTEAVKLFKYLTDEQELPSLICLPVVKQEERLGTLIIGKKKENAFMDGRAFYENIASQLSIGFSNARLYAQMNDMAVRDGLTRIYNRRYLSDKLNMYLGEAMVKKVPVSLALFDIDKFKMVNDTYGHQCGDEVIRYVAALLNRGAVKNGGIAGRYGGEEFVIAFYDKTLEETYEIVDEIHRQIKSEPVVYGDNKVEVRASVGVASYPKTCSNPSDLLTRADWAMYHSKRNGRDQITIDSDKITDKM